jgi:hypothetical protein
MLFKSRWIIYHIILYKFAAFWICHVYLSCDLAQCSIDFFLFLAGSQRHRWEFLLILQKLKKHRQEKTISQLVQGNKKGYHSLFTIIRRMWQFYIFFSCIKYTSSWARFELKTLVVTVTDFTGNCKSNYHAITLWSQMPPDMINTLLISSSLSKLKVIVECH